MGHRNTVFFIPARIVILVPGNVHLLGVVVVADDVTSRPAIRYYTKMPMSPGRIFLAKGTRNQGANNCKHGKQNLPIAGHRRHSSHTIQDLTRDRTPERPLE